MIDLIQLDANSRTPKYKQIIDSIIHNISIGNLSMDQKIPSINMFSEEFYLSRDTVEKAYKVLKERNIITSIRGKGFYITRTKLISKVNILFLVNKMSPYKMKIYNTFLENLGEESHVDFHCYHCDETLFLELLDKYKSTYDYFVIMPHFRTQDLVHANYTDKVNEAINNLPKERLVLLDNNKHNLQGDFAEVYQEFDNDIFSALTEGLERINNYNKLFLAYPKSSFYPYPKRILNGFMKFCSFNKIDFEIIEEVTTETKLEKGSLFITIGEDDLVNLVNQIRARDFKLGEDIGVISYNDTPLKQLLGITVVSADFDIMGESAAKMILENKREKIKVPFSFINRESA